MSHDKVVWHNFFRGNISMTTKSNTSDTERHIDSLKYTKTNLLLFLGFVPKFLWRQWYKWICPISIYWASRDMHQHLDMYRCRQYAPRENNAQRKIEQAKISCTEQV